MDQTKPKFIILAKNAEYHKEKNSYNTKKSQTNFSQEPSSWAK